MTWLTFEMARRPELQRRLHADVDRLYDRVEAAGREIEFGDLQEMTFMTRCITEVGGDVGGWGVRIDLVSLCYNKLLLP